MEELETLLMQVWNPTIRPLAAEAWRSYNAGALRASIAATWTAVTTDIINKLVALADDGDQQAIAFSADLTKAQKKGLTHEGIRAMQAIEANLLAKAVAFELTDAIDQRELERLREDRNLCAHPSLRSSGEVYTPRPESARAHLAVALSTLLVHPPTQGGKAVEAFQNYTCDPSFVPDILHIQTVFFDRVRSAARLNITKIAAKHALRELDPGRLNPVEYANRAAVVLQAFSQRDREMVRSAMESQREPFQKADGEIQLRALSRLGDFDYFWSVVDEALAGRLEKMLLNLPIPTQEWEPLPVNVATNLSVVRSEYARDRLTGLERRFTTLCTLHRMNVVATAPAPYFVPAVITFLREAWNFRTGEQVGQLLVQHAQFLSVDTLSDALDAWAENDQCRKAMQMPDLAAALFRATAHLGAHQPAAFLTFLSTVQSSTTSDDTYYRYPELEGALRAARHLQ